MRGHNRALQVMNVRTRFRPKVSAFLEKTFNWKTVMFESKRLTEHCDLCQVSLKIRQLNNQHSFVYHKYFA